MKSSPDAVTVLAGSSAVRVKVSIIVCSVASYITVSLLSSAVRSTTNFTGINL